MYITTFLAVLLATIRFSHGIPRDQQVFAVDNELPYASRFHKVKRALEKASIINDVVDDFQPKCFVLPVYGKKRAVTLGNHLHPDKTQEEPHVRILCPGMNATSGMTLVLTDPDAPSRAHPKWGEFCHWIAGVEAVRPDEFEIKYSDVVKYKAPAPPKGTRYHRYVFLVLEGVNTNLTKPEGRKHWGYKSPGHGVREWAGEEGLKVVGGNFFYAKYHG